MSVSHIQDAWSETEVMAQIERTQVLALEHDVAAIAHFAHWVSRVSPTQMTDLENVQEAAFLAQMAQFEALETGGD